MWHTSNLAGIGSCNCYLCQPKPSLNAYLPRPATRAPLENAYYLVAVSGGTVLSKRPDGIFNKDAFNSDTQRWRVEYGAEENHVALMNVSDGKWLRARSGAAYGQVDTSDEKQWWVIEEGSSPGSCWLKCSDFADAYLCNANGSFVDGNATFTRPKQTDRAHTLTWTLRDADAVGYDAKGWMISMSSDLKTAREEVNEREQAVSEKESCLLENERCLRKKESSLHQRESIFLEKESSFLEKESILREKETSLREEESRISKKEIVIREKESSLLEKESGLLYKERQSVAHAAAQKTKENELMAREAELRKLADRLDATEAAQQKKAEEWTHREKDLTRSPGTNKDIAMLKAQNDSLHLHIRTASLEREVEKVRQRSNSISNTEQLRNLEVEKARLRVLLNTQQQKARSSPSPNQTRDATSIFNSPSSLATRTVKSSQTSTLGRNDHRPTSSSGSISRRPLANPSLVTPSPSLRYTNKDTPSTPTRASTGMFSSTSGTQRSYDSRFSGWPEEDDVCVPATPTRSSKRATSSTLGLSTPLTSRDQTRLSKESLLSSNSSNRRAVSSQMKSPGPGSSISQMPSVSSAGGKTTSKSTPARSQPPQMSTLRYGAPNGLLALRDDGDAITYACGHKVYKPPRKLNKNVVGYLYE